MVLQNRWVQSFLLGSVIFALVWVAISQTSEVYFPEPGSYGYTGEQVPLGLLIVERIDTSLAKDVSRLNQLKERNFNCFARSGDTYRCHKFTKLSAIPVSISEKIDDLQSGNFVEVDKEVITKNQSFITDEIEEWTVHQVINFNGKLYNRYKLVKLDKYIKVKLESSEDEGDQFLMDSQGQFLLLNRVKVSTDSGWNTYLIYSVFRTDGSQMNALGY